MYLIFGKSITALKKMFFFSKTEIYVILCCNSSVVILEQRGNVCYVSCKQPFNFENLLSYIPMLKDFTMEQNKYLALTNQKLMFSRELDK